MLRLRDALSFQEGNENLTQAASAAWVSVIQLVTKFFYEKLTAMPEIKSYMDSVSTA